MVTSSPRPITFVVPGTAVASRGGTGPAPLVAGWPGQVKASVRVAARRDGAEPVRVSAVPGQDVVLLHIGGGPVLVLHPDSARDLLLGQGTAQRSSGAGRAGEVAVPVQLRWRGLEQAAPTRGAGFLGEVLLSAFEVITGLGADTAARLVASQVVAKVDGQVEAGVYALQPDALPPLKGSGLKRASIPAPANPATEPLLVLVHGTFVDTCSTFGKLWQQHPQRVAELFAHYGGRVYALDHPTVGVSPLANALTLVQALPPGARLHLATHSRGGLVAEVLARVAGQGSIDPADLAFFDGEAYATQRQELRALADAVRAKGIRVDRVVRVACPARGTLLASGRLDAYLSVLKWTLELAGVPAVPSLVGFLTEVARRRADPAELPGLASMIPDTPLVNWLNAAEDPIPGELRVVAGDLQGDSVGSWIKTLLADAYYWTDNDIVVHTRSMYGGSPREGGASFLLDQGGEVNHFNYFANERTAQAVVAGLTQSAPAGYAPIGPLSWAGQDAGGLRGAAASPAPDKPAVFVLPGIVGSHLKAGDKRIWLSLRLIGGLWRLRYQAGGADGVSDDGPVGMVYDDLIEHLAASHEVIPFGYDWRRPVEDEARRLAAAVEQALDARAASGEPVRIIAHSMGGVLARTMQLECPQTFDRLMQHPGARLLMLGTPNGGSWAPMQVLSGDDTFGNALAGFGSPLRDRQARQWMAEMPGFLQLQAGLLDPALALDRADTWKHLAEEDLKRVQENNWWHSVRGDGSGSPDAAYEWGVPTQAVLDRGRALRQRLDAQRDAALQAYAERVLLVVGHARFTPDGYEWGADGFVYLDATDGGDGRVPLASALLPGVRTWTLDCGHGGLPEERGAFEAYVELLTQGDTGKLPRLAASRAAAGAAAPVAHVRSRPSRARPSALPAVDQRAVFAAPDARARAEAPRRRGSGALRVGVLNGNLAFVRSTLMVGHTRSHVLTGSERVVNTLIGGAMKTSLDAGLYPDAPGTHQLFRNRRAVPDNPWRAPQPALVLVAGLGEEGKLTEQALTLTVRQAVIAWAQRQAENGGDGDDTELCATLMGSGGVGMNASNAARAIAQGVRDANERLGAGAGAGGARWPVVGRLTLVELYLERASDAWHGLQVLATAAPGSFEVAPTIASGIGPLRRQVDTGYRGADYDFIAATSPSDDTISFALDTKRARTEVRAQSTQGRLLRELVTRASTESNQDPRLGRTLFQLLVPAEVEPFLAGTSRMLLDLDDKTAAIPWELLDTRSENLAPGDARPWAIRCQLLRKLRQEHYRQQVQDASADDGVLVIGEPRVDDPSYPPLPGARAEAQAVAAALAGPGGLGARRVTALTDGQDAASIINALFERRYRIVHVAGHGEPVKRDTKDATRVLGKGGVVLSDGTFLGSDEIRCMRTVPELVFVNCCHLAAREPGQVLRSINRAEFAWGVADSLIEIGVRCVIAAGWAVDDEPAKVFATTFYREILARRPFIAAVAAAREAAWNADRSSNTWAAYQAYGDPDWTYRRGAGESAAAPPPAADEYAGVASPLGLTLALEELAVQSRWMQAEPRPQLQRLRQLQERFGALWGGIGAVAEAFAVAAAEAGDRDAAIAWYERALQSNDASASIKAHEQLGNLRARRGWARADRAAPGSAAFAQAREEVQRSLHELQALAALQPTQERYSLCGSAFKRLALLEARAGKPAAEATALKAAAQAYERAEDLAGQRQDPDLFYPALNRMALQLVANAGHKGWPGCDAGHTELVRRSLLARAENDPDFWCFAGQVELDLLLAVAAAELAGQAAALQARYAELYARVSAPSLWGSVNDQATLVLRPYAARATAREKAAAQAVLALLADYAGA